MSWGQSVDAGISVTTVPSRGNRSFYAGRMGFNLSCPMVAYHPLLPLT